MTSARLVHHMFFVYFLQFKLTSTMQQISLGHNKYYPQQIKNYWKSSVVGFMSQLKSCKIQIISATELESDEMLSLADYYVNELGTSVLVYSAYNNDGTEREHSPVYDPSSNRKEFAEFWRHTHCYTQVFTSDLLNRKSRYGQSTLFCGIGGILYGMSDNPNFLIMLLNGDQFEDDGTAYDPLLPTQRVSLIAISITSMFVGIRNGRQVDLICIPCLYGLHQNGMKYKLYKNIDGWMKLSAIIREWNRLHSDMKGGRILWTQPEAGKHCSPIYDGLKTPPCDCAMRTMESLANFTIIDSKQNVDDKGTPPILSEVISWRYSSPSMFTNLLDHRNHEATEWISMHGDIINFYVLAVFSVRDINISAFWRALDLSTWMITLLAAVLTSVSLHVLTKNSDLRSLVHTVALTLGFLIDHGRIPARRKYDKVYIKAAMLLFLWTQIAMMVSSGYRGALFSLLTSTSVPPIPQTTRELSVHPEVVFSTGDYYGNNKSRHSLLHATVEEFMGQTGNTTNPTVVSMRKNTMDFGAKLVWVSSAVTDVAYAQTAKDPNYQLRAGELDRVFSIPPNHVFVGNNLDTSVYTLLLSRFGSKMLIVRGPDLPLMMQHLPIKIFKNYFSVQFKRMLSSIMESGLWRRWEKFFSTLHYYERMDAFFDLAEKRNDRNETMASILRRRRYNNMALLFISNEVVLRDSNRRMFEPLPLTVLQAILALYGFMILMSSLQLVWEIVKARVRNNTMFVLAPPTPRHDN